MSLQSEINSLSFDDLMARHQEEDENVGFRRTVEYLRNIIPQLVLGFLTE